MTELDFDVEPSVEPDMADKHVEDLSFYAKRKITHITSWAPSDSSALDEIRGCAQEVYFTVFKDSIELIEEVFAKAKDGGWNGLSNRDLEGYLLKLSEHRIASTIQIKSVQMDALFSKYLLEDKYHDSYMTGSGTNALREAKAHTETLEERYAYFFRFYIWTMCDALAREIDGLTKNLNGLLYRRSSHA